MDIEVAIGEIQSRIGHEVMPGDDVGYGITADGAVKLWYRPKGETAWEYLGEIDAGR